MKHERRVVGHASGWKEQMNTCVCGKPWPCPELEQPTSNGRMQILARYLRSQIALTDRPPVGRVELNNEEAEVCAKALDMCSLEPAANQDCDPLDASIPHEACICRTCDQARWRIVSAEPPTVDLQDAIEQLDFAKECVTLGAMRTHVIDALLTLGKLVCPETKGATPPQLCGCDAPYREGYECMRSFNSPDVQCKRLQAKP